MVLFVNGNFNDFYHFFVTLKNGAFLEMVILVVFKWLKIAKVRPFLRQKGPFIPTDTFDFALKINVAEIKKKVDDIDIDKINGIDELQGKNYIENSYLYLNQKYKYFKYDKTDTQKLLPWQSAGISNKKLPPIKDTNSPSLLFEKTKPYLKINSLKFLAQGKLYTHKSIVNIYIVYLMPDITDAKGSDLLKYGLFGATGYDTNTKLVGYGVGFGTHKFRHDDGKEARNLVILGTSPNVLVLGKGSIKVTTNDSAAIQAKNNFTIPDKVSFVCAL